MENIQDLDKYNENNEISYEFKLNILLKSVLHQNNNIQHIEQYQKQSDISTLNYKFGLNDESILIIHHFFSVKVNIEKDTNFLQQNKQQDYCYFIKKGKVYLTIQNDDQQYKHDKNLNTSFDNRCEEQNNIKCKEYFPFDIVNLDYILQKNKSPQYLDYENKVDAKTLQNSSFYITNDQNIEKMCKIFYRVGQIFSQLAVKNNINLQESDAEKSSIKSLNSLKSLQSFRSYGSQFKFGSNKCISPFSKLNKKQSSNDYNMTQVSNQMKNSQERDHFDSSSSYCSVYSFKDSDEIQEDSIDCENVIDNKKKKGFVGQFRESQMIEQKSSFMKNFQSENCEKAERNSKSQQSQFKRQEKKKVTRYLTKLKKQIQEEEDKKNFVSGGQQLEELKKIQEGSNSNQYTAKNKIMNSYLNFWCDSEKDKKRLNNKFVGLLHNNDHELKKKLKKHYSVNLYQKDLNFKNKKSQYVQIQFGKNGLQKEQEQQVEQQEQNIFSESSNSCDSEEEITPEQKKLQCQSNQNSNTQNKYFSNQARNDFSQSFSTFGKLKYSKDQQVSSVHFDNKNQQSKGSKNNFFDFTQKQIKMVQSKIFAKESKNCEQMIKINKQRNVSQKNQKTNSQQKIDDFKSLPNSSQNIQLEESSNKNSKNKNRKSIFKNHRESLLNELKSQHQYIDVQNVLFKKEIEKNKRNINIEDLKPKKKDNIYYQYQDKSVQIIKLQQQFDKIQNKSQKFDKWSNIDPLQQSQNKKIKSELKLKIYDDEESHQHQSQQKQNAQNRKNFSIKQKNSVENNIPPDIQKRTTILNFNDQFQQQNIKQDNKNLNIRCGREKQPFLTPQRSPNSKFFASPIKFHISNRQSPQSKNILQAHRIQTKSNDKFIKQSQNLQLNENLNYYDKKPSTPQQKLEQKQIINKQSSQMFTPLIVRKKAQSDSNQNIDYINNILSLGLQQSEVVKQNENIQKQVWEEFGSYISRNLKGGRAVKVINFGVFTFCYPEVTLSGVTASEIHDKKERQPIFLINKEFIKGQQIKQGICTNQGIRPASFFGLTGQIQTQQINYYEIACQVNTSKEVVKYSLQKDYKLNSSDFISWLYKQEQDLKQSENNENRRINNAKFARYIHKYITQDLSPSYLEQLVVAIDIDQDGYIDKYDIDAFITKYIVLNSKQEDVQPQEAFKLVDMDFDGIISKRDLLQFLKNVINVPETQLSEVNINRLYKLLDKFKRQKILQGDFIELIFESSSKQIQSINSNNNTQIFNSPMEISSKNQSTLYTSKLIENQKGKIPLPISINNLTQAKSVTSQSLSAVFNTDITKNQNKFSQKQLTNLDWKSNAIKQIGFYLVRNYGDNIQQSFETITNMGQKLLFSIFKEWLQQNKVLQGLELTNNLLQQLFSELDAHKKGYLSKQDWINVFGNINKNDLTYQEIKDVLNQHFSSPYDAFKNLLFYGQKNLQQKQNKENIQQTKIQDKLLYFDAFYNSVSLQIPNRFNKEELLNYWKFLTVQNDGTKLQGSLTYKQFLQVFYKHYSISDSTIFSQRQLENKGPQINSSGILTLENNTQSAKKYHVTNYLNKIKYNNSQSDTVDVIEKLKRLLRSSDTPNLVKHFEKFDSQKCGKLTNLDFRLALRELHLSLSQTDLDQCLIIAKTEKGGFVDYYDFIKKITPGDLQALIIKRAKAYLEKIREGIYLYMFSPKDAFRQYNTSQSGLMTISEFQNFLNKLSQISSQSITPYSLMRDVFEFIDIRNDGVIDLHEWMESFRKLDSQTQQQRLDQQMGKIQEENQVLNKDLQLTQGFDIKLFDWECTKYYDQALKIIGKNRKPLLKEFQKKEQKTQQKITFSEAKTILQNLLSQYMQLSEKNYNSLIKFAEKNGSIEYQFMFDVYKNRLQQIYNQPQNNKINQIIA
ncbi:hypothetical protein PPERSA_06787 [Pseudocohnilembus persalinus]|uniref:EF-hand domain-containing protein n=1 Tax=Pseudocohnilembus persalinus TaxID=266149 RepID=A0A0V0QSI7_PSEPJ|nr:hypothetical protein PPERSA_06787 [Pseudocohnilembus persalinus]|eukprot:KRX05153.1 hypothetical protein PPERSA_06787 [Pseudocohnilembus persalinus]